MLLQTHPCPLREAVVGAAPPGVLSRAMPAEARLVAALAAAAASPASRPQLATAPPPVIFTAFSPTVVSRLKFPFSNFGPSSNPLTKFFFLQEQQPFTPQRADAASMVYGSSYREAGELTPRTQDATSNLMNKSIDRLHVLSKDLINHLSIEGEVRDETWVHELRFHKDVFNNFHVLYAQEADAFIDIVSVGERTKASEVPMLWEKMTKGVAIANLASLLSDVEDLDGDPSNVLNRLPLLQRLDVHFPTVFAPGGQKGLQENPDWMNSTFPQAFTIRVHRFIESLRGVQEVAPIRHYATIFLNFDFSTLGDHEIEQFLNKSPSTPFRDFAGIDINGHLWQKFRDIMNNFRIMLWDQNEENRPVDTNSVISKLGEEYSFDLFLQDLKEWTKTFGDKVLGVAQPAYNGDSAYLADAQLQAEAAASPPGR